MEIRPEDYVEPRCVLCDEPYGAEPAVRMIPQQRIVQKLNELMDRRDYEGVGRHLRYWLEEARLGHDQQGELMVRNELIGHYRKLGEKEAALEHAEAALQLLKELEYEGSVTFGTTCVNIATAYQAFGDSARALELFEQARLVYEKQAQQRPELLGGLCNNMALSCVSLKRYEDAFGYYKKALDVMASVPGGELEQAITWLNMADARTAKDGPEESEKAVNEYLERAYELLANSTGPRNGYYAFVCEKCAPAFSYYGYFMQAQELSERAQEIYSQNQAKKDD